MGSSPNSRVVRGPGLRGGTKVQVRQGAGERPAFTQQLSSRVHVGTWAGGHNCLNLRISQEKEIISRCAVSGSSPRTPFVTPVLPGPGSEIRMKMGWKVLGKTRKSGVWFFRDAGVWLGDGVWPMLMGAVDWVRKGSYHTAWAVSGGSLCTCSYAYGRGPVVGPHTGEGCWPLLAGVWRAIAPLMKPWCAEGEVPTAANLNLHRGLHSRVGWHCDDEPLFGGAGCSKLTISVSLGSTALFKWKGESCPDSDVNSCYLGHGDILVMDGQCQDEFLHCTNPCLEQERINVTFRWIRQHTVSCPLRAGVVCCLPTCAQCFSAPVMENGGSSTFWVLWGLLGVLCVWRILVLLVFSLTLTGPGLRRCAFRWTRFLGGGRRGHFFRNSWEFLGSLKKVLLCFIGGGKFLGI